MRGAALITEFKQHRYSQELRPTLSQPRVQPKAKHRAPAPLSPSSRALDKHSPGTQSRSRDMELPRELSPRLVFASKPLDLFNLGGEPARAALPWAGELGSEGRAVARGCCKRRRSVPGTAAHGRGIPALLCLFL